MTVQGGSLYLGSFSSLHYVNEPGFADRVIGDNAAFINDAERSEGARAVLRFLIVFQIYDVCFYSI